jgi:hypothetical protein
LDILIHFKNSKVVKDFMASKSISIKKNFSFYLL